MKTELEISPDLSLPLDVVTDTVAIVAKRRSGKTYTANVLAEEFAAAGAHFGVVDPLGVWYGLRAGADGDPKGGIPIVIIGGDHADIPLDPAQGAAVADLVTSERISFVLDVSRIANPEMLSFMAAFLQRLFQVNRSAFHLFVDEADMFAPQTASGGQTATLAALDTVVRRGGQRGLGTTLITQRPAVLSKNILTQAGMLIALRITSPQDRAAVDEWVKGEGTPEQRKTVSESLATMKIGEAWVWAPNHDVSLTRLQIRKRRTFDASATPKVGESVRAPIALADINLSALAARFEAKVDAAKDQTGRLSVESDPVQLRARIAELERKIAASPTPEPVVKIERETVYVPMLTDGDREHLERIRDAMQDTATTHMQIAHESTASAKDLMNMVGEINARLAVSSPPASPNSSEEKIAKIELLDESPKKDGETSPVPTPSPLSNVKLSRPQQAILDALGEFASVGHTTVSRAVIAIRSGASPRSSSFSNNLSALRTAGLVEYPNGQTIALTEAGRKQAAIPSRPLSLADYHAGWQRLLTGPQVAILRYLINLYPRSDFRMNIANAAGASPTSSSYSNNLGTLRSFGLIDYPDGKTAVATPLLFPEGLS